MALMRSEYGLDWQSDLSRLLHATFNHVQKTLHFVRPRPAPTHDEEMAAARLTGGKSPRRGAGVDEPGSRVSRARVAGLD